MIGKNALIVHPDSSRNVMEMNQECFTFYNCDILAVFEYFFQSLKKYLLCVEIMQMNYVTKIITYPLTKATN